MSEAAALMDRMYHRQRHIYDFSRKYYLLGRDAMIAKLAVGPGGAILEIGCGTARNLIQIARAYPNAVCCGLDVSAEMLDTAQRAVTQAELAERIALAQGDATLFDASSLFGRSRFERIVVSYALSMIPYWREALAHAIETLAPGGSLHIVDFGDQAGLPSLFRIALRRWLAAFDVTPRLELRDALAELAATQGLSWRADDLFRGYAISASIARPLVGKR
ncbi:MAG TPA: class I SAM-dependent methyltransferase [Roseiarcus sp.]|nr:class I SAM-dependent methyltransferase [Roseiarcus sp.]